MSTSQRANRSPSSAMASAAMPRSRWWRAMNASIRSNSASRPAVQHGDPAVDKHQRRGGIVRAAGGAEAVLGVLGRELVLAQRPLVPGLVAPPPVRRRVLAHPSPQACCCGEGCTALPARVKARRALRCGRRGPPCADGMDHGTDRQPDRRDGRQGRAEGYGRGRRAAAGAGAGGRARGGRTGAAGVGADSATRHRAHLRGQRWARTTCGRPGSRRR